MRRLRKVIAVLLVAVVFFAAVPLKSNNNTVLADVTYVDREQRVPNFMDGIYQFLDRLYYIALGRTTDPDGRFNWFNHIFCYFIDSNCIIYISYYNPWLHDNIISSKPAFPV